MNEQPPENAWDKFLNPHSLRTNLITVSLFICAYELFKDTVTEKPRSFYMTGFDENGIIVGDGFKRDVSSKHANPLYAAILWLQEQGAINDDDVIQFHFVREHRNQLAHEILRFITEPGRDVDADLFSALINLLRKIETWWFINFELAINGESYPDDVDPEEVTPGTLLTLQLMLEVALGTEPEKGHYYHAYQAAKGPRT
jgi:hypothetical protein